MEQVDQLEAWERDWALTVEQRRVVYQALQKAFESQRLTSVPSLAIDMATIMGTWTPGS